MRLETQNVSVCISVGGTWQEAGGGGGRARGAARACSCWA